MEDALVERGDEGRSSLRKASGSWQASFDPAMSEWGNPMQRLSCMTTHSNVRGANPVK